MDYKEKFLETINKIAEEEISKVKINQYYLEVLENKDNVITDLLKRIADLEREVERLEQNKENTIKYCRNSSLILKSHYFIDVINILEGAKYERY